MAIEYGLDKAADRHLPASRSLSEPQFSPQPTTRPSESAAEGTYRHQRRNNVPPPFLDCSSMPELLGAQASSIEGCLLRPESIAQEVESVELRMCI
jgi:hypothetical protein